MIYCYIPTSGACYHNKKNMNNLNCTDAAQDLMGLARKPSEPSVRSSQGRPTSSARFRGFVDENRVARRPNNHGEIWVN